MSLFRFRRSPKSMRKAYDWFCKYYRKFQLLPQIIAEAVDVHAPLILDVGRKTALEYACGIGFLTLPLASFFKSVTARDLSPVMLAAAKERATRANLAVDFREGNLLEIDETDKTYDWAFISFALHLFSPENQELIISRLLHVAREGVIVIDHTLKREFITSLLEWLEGGYYDKYLKMDYREIAQRCNAREFDRDIREHCIVMTFRN